ncbi:MAG: hypothetical protein P3W93_010670 [Thermus sp.]|nr:hypothetical protein [Thermus sp.]
MTQALTLAVGQGVATGTYALRVKATGGSLTKTADLTLTVTAAPAVSQVTLTVQDPGNVGYTLAYQVGSGNWTALTHSADNTYTLNLTSDDKYGVAVFCGARVLKIIQATATEVPNPRVTCSNPSSSPRYVSYTLNLDLSQTGAQQGDMVSVFVDSPPGQSEIINDPGNTSVNLRVPEGTYDLLVAVYRNDPNNPNNYPISAEVLKNITLSEGGSSSHTLGAPLGTNTVTVNNVPSGLFRGGYVLFTNNNNVPLGFIGFDQSNTITYRQVRGFGPGDKYLLVFFAQDDPSNPNPRVQCQYIKVFSGGDVNLSLPNPWSPGSLTITDAPHPTVQGLNRTEAGLRAYAFTFGRYNDWRFRFNVVVTKGWLGTATSYTVPDLSGLLNYTPFANGDYVQASVYAAFSPTALTPEEVWLTDPSVLTDSTDISFAIVNGSYTVGGGSIQLP